MSIEITRRDFLIKVGALAGIALTPGCIGNKGAIPHGNEAFAGINPGAISAAGVESVETQPQFWHQTTAWTIVAPDVLRQNPYWQPYGVILDESGIVSYDTLLSRGLAGLQPIRHTCPNPFMCDPHSLQLWVGDYNGGLAKAQEMNNFRCFYPPVARSSIAVLLTEEQRLLTLGNPPMGALDKVRTEIDLNITRLLLAQDLADDSQLAPYLRSWYRPVILGLNLSPEEVNKVERAASVRSNQISWDRISVIHIGTDASPEELEVIRQRLPGVQILQTDSLRWTTAEREQINLAIGSINDSTNDHEMLAALRNSQSQAVNMEQVRNIWKFIPQKYYNGLWNANEFIVYRLPEISMAAYILWQGGNLVYDIWDVSENYPAETNMSRLEWLIRQSKLGQTFQPRLLDTELHLGENSPNFDIHTVELPAHMEPLINLIEEPMLKPTNVYEEAEEGELVAKYHFKYIGDGEDGPIIEDVNGNQMTLTPDSTVSFCISRNGIRMALEYKVVYKRIASDIISVSLMPKQGWWVDNNSCIW